MRKWEETYEKLKNGDFDARIDELKSKIDSKKCTREELKEYESLSRAKGNVKKVENIIEYRDKSKRLLDAIKKELETRETMKKANAETEKLEAELAKIEEAIRTVNESLKDKNLTDEKKAELESKRAELQGKKDNNNKKYAENQKKLQNGLVKDEKLKDYSDQELQEKKLEASSRISKCNMIANSLVKGLSWDSIDLKLDNWDKKFTSKDKKLSKKDKDKSDEEKSDEKKEDKDFDKTDLNKNKDSNKENEEKSDFANKHPRLAKIGNWFKKIFNKDKMLPPGKEENEPKKPDESFKEYIKFVAEYGHENARKEQIKSNKDLRARYEEMKEANRKAEEKKFGKAYADMSRTGKEEEGR